MGLPGFFAWLLRNFKSKILLKRLDLQCNHFYIDSNCLFHPECNRIKESFPDLHSVELEQKMFKRIENYLSYLYNFVNANKTNGTMVDGVCPLAKMSQQRIRRFKSIDDTIIRNNLKRKYGKSVNENWNSTVITPGTEFMERLHLELMAYFEKLKRTSKTTHIYSSYHTPAEGEHSILQHIKKNVNKDDPNDNVVVIYGLDADLIFLAMTSGIENIYLLREAVHFGIKSDDNELYDPVEDVAQELIYVSIKAVKEAFNQQLRHLMSCRNDIRMSFSDSVDFSNDLVVICFLLGNDFLPHFPSINIHKGGLDTILDSYIEVLAETGHTMTTLLKDTDDNKLEINQVCFDMLIEKLARKEDQFFREGLPYYEFQHNKRKCMAYDDYSKELWNLENLKIFEINDPIQLGTGEPYEWKFRYYEHYFGVSEHQQEFIEELVRLYLEGVMWVGKYYFESCPAWKWHYPYGQAPFISDIYAYLRKYNPNINNIRFNLETNVSPMVQLLAVLPPASSYLLAKSYAQLMLTDTSPIIDMFPIKVELDMLYKDQFWQCTPKLPTLCIDRIEIATNDRELTKSEIIRNTQYDNFVFEGKLKK